MAMNFEEKVRCSHALYETSEGSFPDNLNSFKEKLTGVIVELLENNQKNLKYVDSRASYSEGYYDGIHDVLIAVLKAMEIECPEKYL